MNASRNARYAALALWLAAVLCFAGSWFYDDQGLVAIGAALLALYVILAARTRGAAAGRPSC